MRQFRFRLQSVLSVRKTRERLKQEDLAREARHEMEAQERLLAAQAAHAAALRPDDDGDVNVHDRLLMASHRARLAGAVREHRDRVATAARRTDAARGALIDAAKERTVVENLKTRRRLEHRAEVEQEDQKGLDEIAGRLARNENGNVAVTVAIVIVLYIVLFLGLLKVTGVLDRQVLPLLKKQTVESGAADTTAFLTGDVAAMVRVAELERLAAQRDSIVALSHRLDMKARELDKRIADLENLLAGGPKDETGGKDYANLAAVYAGMKPTQLKPIVDVLDEETLYGVMSHLKGRQLGTLLAVMEPSRAALLSERLATGSAGSQR